MKLSELLIKAYEEKFAIGAFNIYNIESAKAVVEGAKRQDKPALLMLSEKSLNYGGFKEIVGVVEVLKKKSAQGVFLHLDHGTNINLVKECIKAGFDSVMYDGSKLPLDQNIQISQSLRQTAHRSGVIFEAEIGRVGGREDLVNSKNFKTNPAEAKLFADQVKPDILAVAIGNIHGRMTAAEELDFTLLSRISDLVKHPLVLHGCSNRKPHEYKVAISTGVVKINIDTELREAFVEGIKMALKKKLNDPREILNLSSEKISKIVEEKIDIFSCSGFKR